MTKTKMVLCNPDVLLQEEAKRRKQLRLVQVRELAKQNAAKVRDAFKKEKEKQIKLLQDNMQNDFNQRKEEKLEELQDMVYNRMRHFGEGHETAANYDDKTELKITVAIENEAKAQQRGNHALKVHRVEQMIKENKENAHIISRQFAVEQEKLRAAEIAKLPPKVDELNKIVEKSVKLVSYHDANAFMTTRYHMPETIVDKATNDDVTKNAKEDAADEAIRLKMVEQEKKRVNQENKEKARLRGKHALEKEILNENYENILDELDFMQKADRERRQKELLNIPKEIFLPPWQREQERHEKQLDLEREFEKIYANADLRQEVPEPVNMSKQELSSNFDSELDLTVLENKENEVIEDNSVGNTEFFSVKETSENSIRNNNIKLNENNKKITEIKDNLNAQNINRVTAQTPTSTVATSSVTVPVATTSASTNPTTTSTIGSISSLNSNAANNNNANNNPNQENALNKLLQKIRQQRESSTVKNINNKDADISENTPVATPKQTSPMIQPQTPAYIEISHADSTLTSLDSGTITEESKNESNLTEAIQEEIKNNKKFISSVYTNNVSSLDNDLYKQVNDEVLSTVGPQYSVNLSHASKDHMVAGPKELFTENDARLAVEERQKQILKLQKELEDKLKFLEQREKEIRYNEMKSASKTEIKVQNEPKQQSTIQEQQQPIQNNFIIMSGKCVNTNSTTGDSTDRSAHTIVSSYGVGSNFDEQKLREYQQSLLKRDPNQQQTNEFDLNLNIELRKKEILQRFGLTDMTNFNKFNNEKQVAPSIAQLSEDKYTISTDSGFASWRNQHQHASNQQLSTIIPSQKSSLKSDRQTTQINNQDTSLESNFDQLENDSNVPIMQQSGITLNKQNVSKLFGLEYFDSHNSEIRDLSIEQLIGWIESHNSSTKLVMSKSNSSLSLNDLKTGHHDSNQNNKSDTLYESTLSTSSSSSAIFNPNNFENELTITQQRHQQLLINQHNYSTSDDGIEEISDDNEGDDSTNNIIMSLLNSRKLAAAGVNSNNNNNNSNEYENDIFDEDSHEALERRRRFIEEQLELVRAQKEELLRSQQQILQASNNNLFIISNNMPIKSVVNHKMKPPVKSYRTVECNPHELSTIKEENNTPMSERAFRRTGNSTTMSAGNSIDLTSSMEYIKSSNKLIEQTLDDSEDLSTTKRNTNNNETTNTTKNNNDNNDSSISFKSLSPSKSFDKTQQKLKTKNRVAFNLSLFDPGSSMENTSLNLSNLNNNNNNNNTNREQQDFVYKEFGNGIYDASSSTQLENTALKTNLTNETSYQSINNELVSKNIKQNIIQKTLKKIDNETRKKWCDILATTDDDTSSMDSLSEKKLQQQLNSKSLEDSSQNTNHSTLSQGLLKSDDSFISTSSNNTSLSDNSTNKMRISRKIAPKTTQSNNIKQNKIENKLEVAAAQLNLVQQQKLNENKNNNQRVESPIECTKELQLQINDDLKNLDKTLKPYSPVNAIQKEVIKCKVASVSGGSSLNLEKDLNVYQTSNSVYKKEFYDSINSSNSSGKSLKKANNSDTVNQKVAANEIFFQNAVELEAYSKNSLLDEPEISFISIKTNSNVNSPMREPVSTPANHLKLNKNQNDMPPIYPTYFAHKSELTKRFLNISPIEPLQLISQPNSLQSSSDSSSLKNSFKKPELPTTTPITMVTIENRSQSINRSDSTKQQFLTLTAEKTSLFTNETPCSSLEMKQKRQNFESYLSTGTILESKMESTNNQSNLKTLSPTKETDDMHLTIQYENDHMINEMNVENKNSSIIELSQMDNLLRSDRNLLRTPASYFNDETLLSNAESHLIGKSDSLLSFERHEKSVAETTSSSSTVTKKSVYSPYSIKEALDGENNEENETSLIRKIEKFNKLPTKSSLSPVNNKSKQKNELSNSNYQNQKPKSFKSQQFAPKVSELSPYLQKTLKNSFESNNSKSYNKSLTIDDTSVTQVTQLNNQNFDKTSLFSETDKASSLEKGARKPYQDNGLLFNTTNIVDNFLKEDLKSIIKISRGGIQFSIDFAGNYVNPEKLSLKKAVENHETILLENKKCLKYENKSTLFKDPKVQRSIANRSKISKKEMYERTLRLCRYDNKNKNEKSLQKKKEEIKLNNLKRLEYSNYCKNRNKKYKKTGI